jgi:hypothetical protein
MYFNHSAYYTALQLERNKSGYGPEFEAILNEAISEIPEDLDVNFAGLKFAEETSRPRLLRDFSEKFIAVYDEYARNPHHQGCRFTYCFQPENLALASFHAATQELRIGTQMLNRFANMIDSLPPEARQAAVADMQKACGDIGINWTHNHGEAANV